MQQVEFVELYSMLDLAIISQMNTVKLFIFDWSGTISDDRKSVHAASILLSKHYSIEPIYDFNEWLRNTTRGPQEYFAQRGVVLPGDQIWNQYKIYLNQVVSSGTKPVIYDESIKVLTHLKDNGKRLAVISSHPEINLHQEAKEYGAFDFFEAIIGDVHNKTIGIQKIIKELKSSEAEAVYIGDMVSDIQAAQAVPLPIIALSRGYHPKEMLEPHNPTEIWEDLTPFLNKVYA